MIILVSLLFSIAETSSADTIESKGRINWERLTIEEKRLDLENRRLQLEVIKLQIETCKEIYGLDVQARTSCAKKYVSQLSEVFKN